MRLQPRFPQRPIRASLATAAQSGCRWIVFHGPGVFSPVTNVIIVGSDNENLWPAQELNVRNARDTGSEDACRSRIVQHHMTLTAGTRLGPYEILAPIGAGGMGEVYRKGPHSERSKRRTPKASRIGISSRPIFW